MIKTGVGVKHEMVSFETGINNKEKQSFDVGEHKFVNNYINPFMLPTQI